MLFKFFLFVSCAALAAGNSLRSPVPAKEVELDEGVPVSEHELHSIPVDDVKGARIAERLYKSMRDGHKASKETSKAVRAKGVNLLTPSTEVSSDGRRLSDTLESANGWDVKWNGFTQFKQRPNTDCSGVIQTIQGVVSGLCYQDDSATSWIKVGCGSKNNKRALAFYQYALSEGGCTGTPINKVVDMVTDQCSPDYEDVTSTGFVMQAIFCASADAMTDGKPGFIREVHDSASCHGTPLSYTTYRLNACTVDVDFDNSDNDDTTLTSKTTFQYIKYVKCDSESDRGTVVAYSDSKCTRPLYKHTFGFTERTCKYTGDGSNEPFEGDYVKMGCYNP